MLSLVATFLLSVAVISAAPAAGPSELDSRQSQPFSQNSISPWDAGAVTQYSIHSSCNATQRRQIEAGLNETIALAEHARDHILRWGNNSEIYRRYFGNRAPYETIGGFDIIVSGNKAGALFRCDNPDGNCALDGWAGHWRGMNGTGETVICDLSYRTRRSLTSMCGMGYTVSSGPINTFWASDLMHRLYHIPAVGGGYIEHYADGHEEVLALARTNRTEATHDSESLQYFALDAWAYDIAVPGVGCLGTTAAVNTPNNPVSTTAAAASPTSTGTPTVSQVASTTSSLPANCHTHEGGFVHCT